MFLLAKYSKKTPLALKGTDAMLGRIIRFRGARTALALLGLASMASADAEWTALYTPPYNLNRAAALALDSKGNVYVTGSSRAGSSFFYYDECATVKYDPGGKPLWTRRYAGKLGTGCQASAMTIDSHDNLYIAGTYDDYLGFASGFAVLKYDTGGKLVWTAYYDGDGSTSAPVSLPTAITTDAAGNVYVAGTSRGADNSFDYATVKYDVDGHQLWAKRLQGAAGGTDVPTALAADATGNVYVTGYLSSNPNDTAGNDIVTLKYAPNGKTLWTGRFVGKGTGDDRPVGLALDNAGNVYIAGSSWGGSPLQHGSGRDYILIKYRADGVRLWSQRFNGTGNGDDTAAGLVVDSGGNAYLTGTSWGGDPLLGGTGYDYTTLKYAPDGSLLWTQRYDGPVAGPDMASALVLDNVGNLYVTGVATSDVSLEGGDSLWRANVTTLRYDASGKITWITQYVPGGNVSTPVVVQATPAGEAVIVGTVSLDTSSHDAYYATQKLALTSLVSLAETEVTVFPAQGERGQNTTLRARLRRKVDALPLATRLLTFQINGQTVGSARTDRSGLAKLSYTIPADATTGPARLAVSFAKSPPYQASAESATLAINP